MKLMRWTEIWTDILVAGLGCFFAYSIVAAAFILYTRISWLVCIIAMIICLFVVVEGWIRFIKSKSSTPAIATFSKAGSVSMLGGIVAWILPLLLFPIGLQINVRQSVDIALASLFAGLAIQTSLIVCYGIQEGLSSIKSCPTSDNFRSAPYGFAISCLTVCSALCAANLVGLWRIWSLVREPIMNFMVSQ